MKRIIFVSTGRCGTKRLSEILKGKNIHAEVLHQVPYSRLANVAGNILYYTKDSQLIKKKLFYSLFYKYSSKKIFICSDPLTSMIIPDEIIKNPGTMIVHVVRNEKEFADSFFKISRKRPKSFLAHNFIPFWQLGVLPLENILNKKIKYKYIQVCQIKNSFFSKKYSSNPNYIKIDMPNLFQKKNLADLINNFLDTNLNFSENEISKKSN
jgi:hypothetical protein